MTEAIRNSRLGMRVLFVMAAMMLAMMGASVMLNAPTGSLGGSLLGTEEADATTVTQRTIKGTIYRSDSGQAVPYATVELYWWKPNCVQSTCWTYWKTVKANSLGQYSFTNNPTGYSYYVKGWTNVGGQWYKGNSNSFTLSSSASTAVTANATIRMPSPF